MSLRPSSLWTLDTISNHFWKGARKNRFSTQKNPSLLLKGHTVPAVRQPTSWAAGTHDGLQSETVCLESCWGKESRDEVKNLASDPSGIFFKIPAQVWPEFLTSQTIQVEQLMLINWQTPTETFFRHCWSASTESLTSQTSEFLFKPQTISRTRSFSRVQETILCLPEVAYDSYDLSRPQVWPTASTPELLKMGKEAWRQPHFAPVLFYYNVLKHRAEVQSLDYPQAAESREEIKWFFLQVSI